MSGKAWNGDLTGFGVYTGDLLFEVAIHANCIMDTSFVWINPVSATRIFRMFEVKVSTRPCRISSGAVLHFVVIEDVVETCQAVVNGL